MDRGWISNLSPIILIKKNYIKIKLIMEFNSNKIIALGIEGSANKIGIGIID